MQMCNIYVNPPTYSSEIKENIQQMNTMSSIICPSIAWSQHYLENNKSFIYTLTPANLSLSYRMPTEVLLRVFRKQDLVA